MRRAAPAARNAAAMAVGLLGALTPVALGLPARGATAPLTAVGVSEREWRIALYRGTVPLGRVRFNVRNFGEDGHDLVVRGPRGGVLAALGEIRPARTGSLTVRFRRTGRYTLFCSIADHEQRGMSAVIRVRPRRG